jgi:adenylate cyclase
LIDRIAQSNPSVIIFDVAYRSVGDAQEDSMLADAMRSVGNVILLSKIDSVKDPGTGVLTERLLPATPTIGAAALGEGPFPLPKRPHRINQFWTFHDPFGGAPTLPTLALLAPGHLDLDDQGAVSSIQNAIQDQRRALLQVRSASSNSDRTAAGELLAGPSSHYLNYYGPQATLPIVSGVELLTTDLEDDFTGKAVFIGTARVSAYQQTDSFSTVMSTAEGFDLSGVEIAATAYLNLLYQNSIVLAPAWLSSLLLLVTGIGLGALANLLSGRNFWAALAGFAIAYAVGSIILFSTHSFWGPLLAVAPAQIGFAAMCNVGIRSARLQRTITNLVPKPLQEYFQSGAGDRKARTLEHALCLKCDVEDYVEATGRLGAVAIHTHMNAYFDAIAKPVSDSGGHPFFGGGDGFLAVWEDASIRTHGSKIVEAIFEISGTPLTYEVADETFAHKNRIGLASGAVVLGSVGGAGHMTFDVSGDPANLAARLEALNKELGTRIISTDKAAGLLGGIDRRPVGMRSVQGFDAPISIIEVRRPRIGSQNKSL